MQKSFVVLIIWVLLLGACSRQPSRESPKDADAVILGQPPASDDSASQPSPPSVNDLDGFDRIVSLAGPEKLGIHISDHTDERQLAFLVDTRAAWSRFDRFHWDLIEASPQTPPVYDWSSVDGAGLRNSAERGIKLIGIILFTPPYAQKYPGSICGPIAEEHLSRFGEFLHALVSRYSQAPYSIKYWEIGNEPDVDYAFANRSGFGCWGDPSDPYYGGGYYAEMLKIAYPQIKSADPEAQVLIGGLLLDCDPRNPPETSPGSGVLKDCSPARFLDGILENGGAAYFDGISFHAYDYYSFREGSYSNGNWHSTSNQNGVVSLPKARFLQERLTVYGVTGKYLLNTESGLICGRSGREDGCLTDEFAQTKAAYIVHTNTAAFSLGLEANIWYSMMGWRASELVDENYQQLPAFDAFRVNSSFMQDTHFMREIVDYTFFIYEFKTPSGYLWVTWSKSGEPEMIQLPSPPRAIYDLFGNPLDLASDVSVSYSPIYIEY